MRIVFFTKDLPSNEPNGVSWQVHRLANSLVARGHEVTCFSFSPPPESASYRVVQLPWNATYTLIRKFIPAFRFRCIDTTGYDIIHYHGDDYLCKGSQRRLRTFYGTALLEAFHSKVWKRRLRQLLFYGFEWISCSRKGTLVGISHTTLKWLPLVKMKVPCMVPLDRYRSARKKSTTPRLLFIGDLYSRKRGNLLIDTFQNVLRPAFPDCELVVVGPERCTGPGIVYLGRIGEQQLVEEYRKAWIYCMVSSYEGFGVPVIEAMACGAAVVATDNCGVREIIRNGTNGIICDTWNLGTTISFLIENADYRRNLVQGGYSAVARYSARYSAELYETMYKKVLSQLDFTSE